MPQGFERRQYFEPSRVDSGAAQVYGTLSDRLGEWAARSRQTATGHALREAVRSGQTAGSEGVPVLRSEWTEAGRVYNDTAMRTYIAGATADIETTFDRLEGEAAFNLEQYDQTTDGALKGQLGAAPDWAKPDINAYVRRRIAEGRVRVEGLARAREQEEARVAVLARLGPLAKRAATLGAMDSPEMQEESEIVQTHALAMIESAVNDGTLSPGLGFELAERFKQNVADGAHDARIDGFVNEADARMRVDIDAGDSFLAEVAARDDVTPNDLAEIRSKVNGRLNLLHDERQRTNADSLAELEQTLAADQASRRTARLVEDLYSAGALTPGQAADYHGRIEGSIRKRAEEDAITRELSAAIASGMPLDPGNSDHKKALALAFGRDTAEQAAGSEQWQQLAIHYAGKTRMLPMQATAWVRQGIRSPDPTVAAAAAQFYGAVQAAVPDAADGFDTDTRAFAGMVSSMLEVGTDPVRAIETARALVYEVKPELRERRVTEYRQHAKMTDAALLGLVDRDFDPGLFASAPLASAGLRADFAGQSERYYQKTGDFMLASELAWRDLKRVYGPSEINGRPMLMAFPPEKYGVTPAEVRQEIGNFLKGNPQTSGVGADSILVIPDSLTLRRVNDAMDGSAIRPSYRLITTSGDLVVNRDGVPQRYTIPTVEQLTERLSLAQEEARIAAEAEVAAAREERAQRVLRREQTRALARSMTGRTQ